MIKLTLDEVIAALGGSVRGDIPTLSIGAVSTDSRTLAPGDLFFAIQGDTFDGHDFVRPALERGAAAVVVSRPIDVPGLCIEVDDTIAALGRLGAAHRRQLAAEVIAVVGSNGKTTTKAMIDHILRARYRGRASPRSFNNAIGVPLTLLSAEPGDEYLVVEVGTNAPGEIAALGALVQPDLAIITSIGEEHLEGLGNLEGVIAEETAILASVRRGGFAAINIDQPLIRARLDVPGITIATFGRDPAADVRVTATQDEPPQMRFQINNRFSYRLKLLGAHNAENAAGAITIARRLGLEHDEIAARLESFSGPPMRNERIDLSGVTVINDAYNANPASAVAALDAFEKLPCNGRRIVVFGEMRELGAQTAAMHRRVAERLRNGRFDRVILVGAAAEWMYGPLVESRLFGPRVERCESVGECAAQLASGLRTGDAVLLKGSRSIGLERVIEPLRAKLGGEGMSSE